VLVAPPPHLHDHRRIVLHGVTGSGKSSLAARLAALTGAPHVSVDDLMWRPGWVQLSAGEEFCGGNTESWRRTLSGDSILAWHHRTFERKRGEAAAWAADAGGPPVVRFTAPREVDAWLRNLERVHP
jgi:ATP-dependent protease HslVU (ClpYQ) ATPase subunit